MQIYLPIAEMAVNAESIFAVSAFVGLLSGMFGVGGGFLTTPFLIFSGIPPAIAVGTQAPQLVASSLSGSLGYFRRGNVDLKMGVVMLLGGVAGSFVGIWVFKLLQYLGQIDFAISAPVYSAARSDRFSYVGRGLFSSFCKKDQCAQRI